MLFSKMSIKNSGSNFHFSDINAIRKKVARTFVDDLLSDENISDEYREGCYDHIDNFFTNIPEEQIIALNYEQTI